MKTHARRLEGTRDRTRKVRAWQKHGQSDAMKAAMADFGPLAAGPPRMSMSKPIAAIGLDL